MTHCSENRFCASLNPELRSKLCQACIKSTYAAGTHTEMDFYHHLLIVDGLCVTNHKHAAFAFRPGDFVVTPHPDTSRETNINSVSFDDSKFFITKLEMLTDACIASFDKNKIDELLEERDFLAASYQNLQDLYAHLVAYFIAMNCSSAYDAVCYVLKYCKQNNFGLLTHAQIAKASGLSRTTVTEIMHEIALSEPELLQ